jgi:SAM-dependent methyltransferase
VYNIQAIDQATDCLMEQGVRVLNAFLLEEDEAAHAKRLLDLMDPPQGAVVLDAGCGVGELARLMLGERPDLTFKLLNVSQHQLDLCPEGMERIRAPFEATGLPDASVDVVLFAFSLCHADDWGAALREAYRVLRPGGVVFIFDMARSKAGSNALMRELLQASAYRPAEILSVAHRCGLELVDAEDAQGHIPKVYRLQDAFGSQAAYETAMDGRACDHAAPVTHARGAAVRGRVPPARSHRLPVLRRPRLDGGSLGAQALVGPHHLLLPRHERQLPRDARQRGGVREDPGQADRAHRDRRARDPHGARAAQRLGAGGQHRYWAPCVRPQRAHPEPLRLLRPRADEPHAPAHAGRRDHPHHPRPARRRVREAAPALRRRAGRHRSAVPGAAHERPRLWTSWWQRPACRWRRSTRAA